LLDTGAAHGNEGELRRHEEAVEEHEHSNGEEG